MNEGKMQYSPKLKKAMSEIKDILHKHDIAGLVVLHTPGYGEYLMELSPSYSRLKIDPEKGFMRFKAKLEDDFKGDKKAMEKAVAETCNMLSIIGEIGVDKSLVVLKFSKEADRIVGAQHGPGTKSSDTAQNN